MRRSIHVINLTLLKPVDNLWTTRPNAPGYFI